MTENSKAIKEIQTVIKGLNSQIDNVKTKKLDKSQMNEILGTLSDQVSKKLTRTSAFGTTAVTNEKVEQLNDQTDFIKDEASRAEQREIVLEQIGKYFEDTRLVMEEMKE